MAADFEDRLPIVLDLEATCWGEDEPELRARQWQIAEIIEIGAVRLDPDSLAIVDRFQTFVRPVERPALTDFCTALTSITQDQVDAAPTLPAAMAALSGWLPRAPVVLCAWGRYEREMFRRRCAAARLHNPFEEAYLDVREEFIAWGRGQGRGRLRCGLAGALEVLELPVEGTLHRGIDDAINLAALLRALRDPGRMSPEAASVLALANRRYPDATHRGHAREALGERPTERRGGLRAWWPQVLHELERLGLAENLGAGRGLRLTGAGLEWLDERSD